MKVIFTNSEALKGLPIDFCSIDFLKRERSKMKIKGDELSDFRSIIAKIWRSDYSSVFVGCREIIGDINMYTEAVLYWKGAIVFVIGSGYPIVDWEKLLPEMESNCSGEPPIVTLSTEAFIKALG
jgi:hypothetical protein